MCAAWKVGNQFGYTFSGTGTNSDAAIWLNTGHDEIMGYWTKLSHLVATISII